jgi:hypothetical protein
MNQQLLQKYLLAYKQNFATLRPQERYKWQAVRHFQDNWHEDADDFPAMLSEALDKTSNLMDAGGYYPKQMILEAASSSPALVRQAFQDLYDESAGREERIETFRHRIKTLVREQSPGQNDYQDHRAVIVYLALRYPDDYYFYKYGVFQRFCEKVGHDYRVTPGAFANIEAYFSVCDFLKTMIQADRELVDLHRNSLAADEYIDGSLNILTQDFVFAVQYYLPVDAELDDTAWQTVSPSRTTDPIIQFASDIDEPDAPKRVETTAYRILRDTKKARNIKWLYDNRCQICGEAIMLGNRPYAEAHHIKPLGTPHNGPDHESNILCVCPNHHVMLDYFAIELDLTQLRLREAHQLNPKYVAYHNRQFNRQENG